jgi:hypothetical protein
MGAQQSCQGPSSLHQVGEGAVTVPKPVAFATYPTDKVEGTRFTDLRHGLCPHPPPCPPSVASSGTHA